MKTDVSSFVQIYPIWGKMYTGVEEKVVGKKKNVIFVEKPLYMVLPKRRRNYTTFNLKDRFMVKRLVVLVCAACMLFGVDGYSQKQKKVKAPDDPELIIFVTEEGRLQQQPTFQMKHPKETFGRWVLKNIKLPVGYPRPFYGTTVVQFYIEPDGDIVQVDILKGCGNFEIYKAVVEVIAQSPKWEPALLDGKPIVLKYTFPVVFRIPAPKPSTQQSRGGMRY